MPQRTTVHVHLQEGFEAEHVIVSIDDTVVLDDPTVRTKPQIGLARTTETETSADPVTVHVELAGRHAERSVQVRPQLTPFIGVSVSADGQVQFRMQAEPFGYV
jgi:hypothetical protein